MGMAFSLAKHILLWELRFFARTEQFEEFKVSQKQLEPEGASGYYSWMVRQSSRKFWPDGIYKHITADFMEDFALIKQDII